VSPDRFLTNSLKDPRIARILDAALVAVDPGRLVRDHLKRIKLPAHDHLFILGIGKASEPMVLAATDELPHFARALVITKHATVKPPPHVEIVEASHPVPDARSVMAGRAALDFASRLGERDLLLCLISGGGSALAVSPRSGIGLRDIQVLTSALLAAGAGIEDINTLRRHLDGFKGGGLARITKAHVLTLLLSDVIGDRLEAIASGPTAPDPTSGADALGILSGYGIQAPPNVYALLSTQRSSGDLPTSRVTNIVIGSNDLAAQAARQQAEAEGFHTRVLRTDLQGEARELGTRLANRLKADAADDPRPFCLIAGGESTVTIHGKGKGGRNQELALAAVGTLAGMRDLMLVALATDGDDGPTDAAGAVVTGETASRARLAHVDVEDHLARNDSYHFFLALGDLLKPGYTGTNVNDLIFLIAL
jgi:hydroxypyruvate reductase